MNILFITDNDLLDLLIYDIHMLAEGLSLLGHRVYAIDFRRAAGSGLGTIETNMARVYPKARVRLIRVGYLNIPKLGILVGLFNAYRTIRRVIRDNDIDVIVLYSVVLTGLPAARLARSFGIPVVFRNIDMLFRIAAPMQQWAVRLFEKMVYKRMDKLFALSPRYAEYLAELGANRSKIKPLPFPLDTELFSPDVDPSEVRRKWRIDERDDVIVFVGYLYDFSGLEDFVRQFPEVVREVPRAKLLIVGDGSLRLKLDQAISELGLEGHVIITGIQPFLTMPQYINLAKICINAYPASGAMRDLFCAKVIQYLACGKATVSSSLPGMMTMLPGESCGVVYADSAAAMAREVVSLLKSPERSERLGKAGRNYVKRSHGRDDLVHQMEAYLEETVREGSMIRKVAHKLTIKE